MLTRRLAATAAACGLLALPTLASASTIHEPADGITVAWNSPVHFDWAWTCDSVRCEWASSIVFAQTPDPTDPIWLGGSKPGKLETPTAYNSNYNVYIGNLHGPQLTFAPGDWWWRLCSKTLEGEDDKCYYDSNPPRRITVLPPPPGPLPPPTQPAPPEPPEPPPLKLSAKDGKAFARTALARVFGRYWRQRSRAYMLCSNSDLAKVACSTDWRWRNRRVYSGVVVVRRVSTDQCRWSLRVGRRAPGSRRKVIVRRSGVRVC
jgi:hypothetical protein